MLSNCISLNKVKFFCWIKVPLMNFYTQTTQYTVKFHTKFVSLKAFASE